MSVASLVACAISSRAAWWGFSVTAARERELARASMAADHFMGKQRERAIWLRTWPEREGERKLLDGQVPPEVVHRRYGTRNGAGGYQWPGAL